MATPDKPDRSNRIILLIFGLLAVVTIGATIYATTSEWSEPPLPAALDESAPPASQ